MLNIPEPTLSRILELRTKNGLKATPEALEASMSAAKCKWTLEDTPRYRLAGESPIYISGKYLTQAGICPATGEKDGGRSSRPVGVKTPKPAKIENSAIATANSEEAFFRVLHAKGFGIKISRDLLTGEITKEVPRAIGDLGLQFSAIPVRTDSLHVIQTSPQIQVAMSLDKFLELAKIKA
ncbi:MAG: hypothetical protein WCH40_05060 [Verrucomicrobiales bacterium]